MSLESRVAEINSQIIQDLTLQLAQQEQGAVALFGQVKELQQQQAATAERHLAKVAELQQEIERLQKPPDEPPSAAVPAVVP